LNLQPIIILGVDHAPLTPLVAADLDPLPHVSTKIHRVTIILADALVDSWVDMGTLTHVYAVTVVDLTGSVVPTMKFNDATATDIPLARGEVRDQLDMTALYVSCAAGGGNLVLELHGR
jgi:hypothetical protein